MENQETPIIYHAAMFKAVGRQAKLSRSGFSLVFAVPQCGRHDLSGNPDIAAAQLRSAGIDLGAVNDADVTAYQQWHDALYNARRVGQARILVTRPFLVPYGRGLRNANRVSLIDGWGEVIHSDVIAWLEGKFDPNLTNRIGDKGAIPMAPDTVRIDECIERLRWRFPDYMHAAVMDNNKAALAGSQGLSLFSAGQPSGCTH